MTLTSDADSVSAMLDIEQSGQLTEYLRARGRIGRDEVATIAVLGGGVSNRTVRVERASGEAWVLKQALAKLRVQVDWFSPPERVHREADGLRWLARLAPPGTITPLVFEDFDHHLIAMQAVPQPHRNWKAMLLEGDVQMGHVEQFATLLGTIHTRSNERLEELRPVFGDRGYFESLRLEPYYGYTATQVQEAATFLRDLMDETRSRAETIVHGDYSPKNVLVHDGRLILLDHEVIHVGDPGFDLGFSMTHLLSKAHHLRESRAAFSQATIGYWRSYWNIVRKSVWTDQLEGRAVRHTLGCLLARARGRSPLEYLTEEARVRQAGVVVALMADPPATIEDLTNRFITGVAEKE